MNDDRMSPEDERTLEFLREMMDDHEEMPLELRLRLEAGLREGSGRTGTPGWKAVAAVSLAAAFVLLITTSPERLDPTYALVVVAAVLLYGAGVRFMLGQAAEPLARG